MHRSTSPPRWRSFWALPPAAPPRRFRPGIRGATGVIDAAKKEGKLIVYSTTDTGLVRPLIKDFESLYGVKVEYNDMNSTELYNRYISENAASSTSADVLWSRRWTCRSSSSTTA